MKKPRIGISIGDVNGVGLEVIIKTFSDQRIYKICTPVIYGSSKVVAYHKNVVPVENFKTYNQHSAEHLKEDTVNVVNVWQESVNIALGKTDIAGGEYAIKSLDAATKDVKEGLIDAMVTAPINKKAMQLAGFQYPGHTEYLTDHSGDKDSMMLMVNDNLRVGLVTNHLPINEVAASITKELILIKINILHETLIRDFGIDKPRIAVLALNPHASDDGVIGDEEEKVIIPAIQHAKEDEQLVFGPFPADGFFGSKQFAKFDGVIAMYHDQGLVPFKTLSAGTGVNYTAGLSFVRTSPDHGTAFDIAGKNLADEGSFRKAVFAAIDIARCRANYLENHSNPLKRQKGKVLENIENEKAFEAPDNEPSH